MDSKPSNQVQSKSLFAHWQQDFLASIVVFLVALPLCMGIAIASGAPASTGLIGGVVGGLVVGYFSGCPLQVSGPAAGLATVMFDAIQRHGLEQLGLMVMIAGLIQLIGGWLRIGQWFRAVSPAVIRGMLAGIGVLILASQFHVMLDDVPKGSGLRDLMTIPQAIQKAAQVPQFSSRDMRHDLTLVLQDIGELHRRQIQLNERIAERVPHHRNRPETPGDLRLEEFIPEQKQIQESLVAVLARCRVLFQDHPDKLMKIEEAGANALAAQRVSLADLTQEQWAFVIPADEEAAETLVALQKVFKNHELAAGVGVLAILALLVWSKIAKGPLKVIPAPLVAVLLSTIAAAWWQLPVLYVEVPTSMLDEMHFLKLSSLADVEWQGILVTSLTIAILASAQTLLTATAVDQLHNGDRTDYDKELSAQGIGNCLCGFVGALPLAAVIVRSTANISAGGKTRLSTIFHGFWMLLSVALLAAWLRMIPTSALAAILVYTGYKLVDWKAMRQFWEYGAGELGVFLVTMGTVVCIDLLTGVVLGFVCAMLLLAYRFSRLRIRLEGPDGVDQHVVRLEGAATFLKLPKLASVLAKLPPGRTVELSTQRLHYIDQACLESLESWAAQYEANGGDVIANWGMLTTWAHQGRHQHATSAVETVRMVEREVVPDVVPVAKA